MKNTSKKPNLIKLDRKYWLSTLQWLMGGAVLYFFALTLTIPINLTTADLGRHIVNGRLLFESGQILATNHYSYVQPDYPTLTTHWLVGVFFFLIHVFFGFYGTQLFYIALYVLAFGLMLALAVRLANFPLAIFSAVLGLPLLVTRAEVRPEVFTYLFIAVFLYVLYRFKQSEVEAPQPVVANKLWQRIVGFIAPKGLWLLLLAQIVWVNSHILFVFGPVLVGLFFGDAWLADRRSNKTRVLWRLLWLTVLSCLINPWGPIGALAPFLVMKEYGYMLAEMQSVTFMLKRGWNPYYFHLQVLAGLIVGASVAMLLLRKFREYRVIVVFSVFTAYFGWQMIRNLPIFGLMFIPSFAVFLAEIFKKFGGLGVKIGQSIACVVVVGLVGWVSFVGSIYCYYIPNTSLITLGLVPNINASSDFIKANKIRGPIFNNYDIGGYLIYHLYPQEKVFVDNRPEAYSVPFFKELYVPMQENDELWTVKDKEYSFNMIIFNRNDMTPWAQPFLIRRIQDQAWAPVFVDDNVLILLKRNEQNARIIKYFELPRSMFTITK